MITTRQVNQSGLAIIKTNVELKLRASRDAGGDLTIGYRHVGRDVVLGKTITPDEADELLLADLAWMTERVLARVDIELNDNELSALVCLAHGIGMRRFSGSTLLKLLNNGEKTRAAEAFLWLSDTDSEDARTITFVTSLRRRDERALFVCPLSDP